MLFGLVPSPGDLFTSMLHTWLKLHLSEQQWEAAFHLESQQPSQPRSDATETKEDGREIWKPCTLANGTYMRLRLVVCQKRLSARGKHCSLTRPLWPQYTHLAFPESHLIPPRLCPASSRESQYPSHCRSPIIPCTWPGVASCFLSAPTIGDQMAFWENSDSFAGKVPGSHPGSSSGCNFPRGQG